MRQSHTAEAGRTRSLRWHPPVHSELANEVAIAGPRHPPETNHW